MKSVLAVVYENVQTNRDEVLTELADFRKILETMMLKMKILESQNKPIEHAVEFSEWVKNKDVLRMLWNGSHCKRLSQSKSAQKR